MKKAFLWAAAHHILWLLLVLACGVGFAHLDVEKRLPAYEAQLMGICEGCHQ